MADTRLAWGAEALWEALHPLLPGLSVEVAASLPSTNTTLIERARASGRDLVSTADDDLALVRRSVESGAFGRRAVDWQPCLLVAERQTAGRGRMGRAWWSGADASRGPTSLTPSLTPSLTFSLGLPLAPRSWSGLSLAVGVALAEALDPTGRRVRLKWPNDLWLGDATDAGGRKFAGVLIETIALPADSAARYAVIGVGLNLDAPAADAGIAQPVAGWREAEPQADAPALLVRLAPALLATLAAFESGGFAAFAGRYARRDALAGRNVTVAATPPYAGRADGVDEGGALRLVTDSGLRLVDSAEVSVRPC